METILIQINWAYFLGIISSLILLAFWSGSRFAGVETSILWIRENVTKIESRMTKLEGRVDNTFGSASPIQLFSRGLEILENSGFKKYIDENKNIFIMDKNLENTKNQYDIQEKSFEFFDNLDFGDFENKIKETSYKYGVSVETIRRIGGIYFRDILLSKRGFTPRDLDVPER